MMVTSGKPGWRAVALAAGVLAVAVVAAVRFWHVIGNLAELLSDAGHGPRRWREDADLPNPYAGIGPIEDDDRPREG
jgi:hypothetical protein